MSRLDEINTAMLEQFKIHGIEDTPVNRHDFLLGLRDAWQEDPDSSIEKSMYMLVITLEITHQRFKATHPNVV